MNVSRVHEPGSALAADGTAGRSMLIRFGLHPGEFTSRLRRFKLDLVQIERGRFTADGIQAVVGKTLLGRVHLGRAVLQGWRSPARSITIAVKTSGARALWRGLALENSDALMLGPDAEIEFVSQAGFQVVAATFPQIDFQRAAEFCGLRARFDELGFALVRFAGDEPADQLRAVLEGLLPQASAGSYKAPKAEQGDGLHALVARILAGGVSIDLHLRQSGRWQALDQTISALRKQPAKPLGVADLCRITGASERALRKAFIDRYTVPPGRLLKALRLNGARHDLRRLAAQRTKIADIANKWGFWHLGQFATDYRYWFEELPSDTHRAGRAANH
jgi:AraC family ethanolamine operon transcriptional activator